VVKLAVALDVITVDSRAPIVEVDKSVSERDSIQAAPVFWARFDEIEVGGWNLLEEEGSAPFDEVEDIGNSVKPG
jgi:hypothetical protein